MEPYQKLEAVWQQWLGWPAITGVVTCSSGTAALHLALESYRFPKGSQVIVPEFTMIACARAVTMAGLRPVFADCNNDLLMDIDKAVDLITEQTVAIMPVHIYGREFDGKKLEQAILAKHDFLPIVVEDCAEAHAPKLGGHCKVSCWSFYKNKVVAGEEGGAICYCMGEEEKYERARNLRCLGFNKEHNFIHEPGGFNYRMSNAHATLILNSLADYEHNLLCRRLLVNYYDSWILSQWNMPPRDVPWVYDILLPEGTNQDSVVAELNNRGIRARHGFKPMSMQPEYFGAYKHLNAYRLSQRVIYLPLDPRTTKDEANFIGRTTKLVIQQVIKAGC